MKKLISFIRNLLTGDTNYFVYQIFYDGKSKLMLDSGFIPLDNTSNERPDWFEFWVIRDFLLKNSLREDSWYGFVSPMFYAKTRINSKLALHFLNSNSKDNDIILFSPGWDQIAYFLNPFEQGEFWHPGLLDSSQQFFDSIGVNIDLRNLVTHSTSTVFSNYIVAKPVFWNKWLHMANQLFEFIENNASHAASDNTTYGSNLKQAPMKTFIQERLASVLMAQGGFKIVAAIDQSNDAPILKKLFVDDPLTRERLRACDQYKQQYTATGNEDYLEQYYKVRAQIPITSKI